MQQANSYSKKQGFDKFLPIAHSNPNKLPKEFFLIKNIEITDSKVRCIFFIFFLDMMR